MTTSVVAPVTPVAPAAPVVPVVAVTPVAPAASIQTPAGTSPEGTPATLIGGAVEAAKLADAAAGAPKESLLGKTPAGPEAVVITPFDAEKLIIPEGFAITPEAKARFGEIAKSNPSLGLETANQMLAYHAETLKAAAEAGQKRWNEVTEGWIKEIKADADFGGAALQPNLIGISKLITQFSSSPEEAKAVRQAMNLTGAGNNPAIYRFLSRTSKALTEGSHISGDTPKPRPRSAAEAMYPNLVPKES